MKDNTSNQTCRQNNDDDGAAELCRGKPHPPHCKVAPMIPHTPTVAS